MPRRKNKGRDVTVKPLELNWLRPCTCGAKAIGYTCSPNCASVLAARAA
jgi:hypothetical protein